MTRYTYRTTITVMVDMADDGEVSEEDGEVTRWARPEDQEESAREWAEQAMPLHETYEESWVSIDCPPLALVKSEPTQEPVCYCAQGDTSDGQHRAHVHGRERIFGVPAPDPDEGRA